jgi:hypothetical protein
MSISINIARLNVKCFLAESGAWKGSRLCGFVARAVEQRGVSCELRKTGMKQVVRLMFDLGKY